jgi:hypothetical protein
MVLNSLFIWICDFLPPIIFLNKAEIQLLSLVISVEYNTCLVAIDVVCHIYWSETPHLDVIHIIRALIVSDILVKSSTRSYTIMLFCN